MGAILSFTYRSNPPPNLFWLYLKILKLVILKFALGKVKSNFDSDIRKISIISNIFFIEFAFRCPVIRFMYISFCCSLIDVKSDTELISGLIKGGEVFYFISVISDAVN